MIPMRTFDTADADAGKAWVLKFVYAMNFPDLEKIQSQKAQASHPSPFLTPLQRDLPGQVNVIEAASA
jgi:hypothetical protein